MLLENYVDQYNTKVVSKTKVLLSHFCIKTSTPENQIFLDHDKVTNVLSYKKENYSLLNNVQDEIGKINRFKLCCVARVLPFMKLMFRNQ